MNHPHGEKISAYIDGMLNIPEMHHIASHIASCSQCQNIQTNLKEIKLSLRRLEKPVNPDPAYWAAAYRNMRVTNPEGARFPYRTVSPLSHAPHRLWTASLAAAALLALALTAPSLQPQRSRTLSSSTASASAAMQSPDTVDVSFLVQAHTESAASQPLADTDRQDMIAMDSSFASDNGHQGADPNSQHDSNATP